jgi:hypothetical protein
MDLGVAFGHVACLDFLHEPVFEFLHFVNECSFDDSDCMGGTLDGPGGLGNERFGFAFFRRAEVVAVR